MTFELKSELLFYSVLWHTYIQNAVNSNHLYYKLSSNIQLFYCLTHHDSTSNSKYSCAEVSAEPAMQETNKSQFQVAVPRFTIVFKLAETRTPETNIFNGFPAWSSFLSARKLRNCTSCKSATMYKKNVNVLSGQYRLKTGWIQ